MLEFYAEHRGLVNSLLVFAFACFIPFNTVSVIRKQNARAFATERAQQPVSQHRLVTALNEMGAIGVGVVWTALIYVGPSLTELWLGKGRVAPWLAVLLYTMFWLSFSRVVVPEDRINVTTAVVVRVLAYGFLFFGAIAALNNW